MENLIEEIARAAHEVDRSFCAAARLPEPAPWGSLGESLRNVHRSKVRMLMEHPEAGPEYLHERWRDSKVSEGWRYGAFRSKVEKTEPRLVSFSKLLVEQQIRDTLFHATVMQLITFAGTTQEPKDSVSQPASKGSRTVEMTAIVNTVYRDCNSVSVDLKHFLPEEGHIDDFTGKHGRADGDGLRLISLAPHFVSRFHPGKRVRVTVHTNDGEETK